MPGRATMAVGAAVWLTLAAGVRAADLAVEVHDLRGRPLANAVVTAAPVGAASPRFAGPRPAVIDQVDKEFLPFVSAVRIGTPVTFPNQDDIRHHVYSFSPAKSFELPLYKGTPAAPVVFDKPGLVILGCNIHDWMLAYLYVVEAPFFATTGADGRALLADLPPGEWEVTALHPLAKAPDAPPRARWSAGAPATVVLEVAVRSEARRSRAPHGDSRGYR